MRRLLIASALMLAACAQQSNPLTPGVAWECHGCAAATRDQLHMDGANCELQVQQMAASQTQRPYYAPTCTADYATCQGFANLGSAIANQGPGGQQIALCMAGKGWYVSQ